MGNIKRSDDIYKEIESFKDYELLIGITYEMYIRNYINKTGEDINKVRKQQYVDFNANNSRFCIHNEFSSNDIILKSNDLGTRTLNDDIYNIFPELYVEDYENNSLGIKRTLKEILDILNNNEKYSFNEIIYYDSFENKIQKLTKDILKAKIRDKLITTQQVTIYYPRPQVGLLSSKRISLSELDLRMSNKEICELLDELRKKILRPEEYIEINNSEKYESYQRKTNLTDSSKMADMFFCYDVQKEKGLSSAKKMKYMEEQIMEYHNYNNTSDNSQTIRNYIDIIRKLIDDEEYMYIR